MSSIVIKDLPESIELDRQAMRTISGGKAGARLGIQPYRSSFFQNPLDFTDLKLIPPVFEPGNDWFR